MQIEEKKKFLTEEEKAELKRKDDEFLKDFLKNNPVEHGDMRDYDSVKFDAELERNKQIDEQIVKEVRDERLKKLYPNGKPDFRKCRPKKATKVIRIDLDTCKLLQKRRYRYSDEAMSYSDIVSDVARQSDKLERLSLCIPWINSGFMDERTEAGKLIDTLLEFVKVGRKIYKRVQEKEYGVEINTIVDEDSIK